MDMKKPKKVYTVSTYIFKSLKEAEEQLGFWEETGCLNPDSKIFEVSGIYEFVTTTKLIKTK